MRPFFYFKKGRSMKFLDEAKIFIKSGNGGPGAVSFRREKFIEFGGPDGGNGGRGGDVLLEVCNNLNTLIDFRYQQHFKAKNGMQGMGRERSGPKGKDVLIKVPVGTQILAEDKETILYDLTTVGEKITLLKGGDGGFGNTHFKSSVNRAPRRAGPGWPGEEMWIWLRLKLIADAGLVGLPNAGKSTFLSIVSKAKPKIADYPFTTLHPNLGVIKYHEHSFVIADIPGLIKGAHQGIGLGTRFLGHVERCAVLIHLIDGTDEAYLQSYQTIREELEKYGGDLIDRPELIVLNKIDALDEKEKLKRKKDLEALSGKKVYLLSAISQKGVDTLLGATWQAIKKNKKENIEEELTEEFVP